MQHWHDVVKLLNSRTGIVLTSWYDPVSIDHFMFIIVLFQFTRNCVSFSNCLTDFFTMCKFLWAPKYKEWIQASVVKKYKLYHFKTLLMVTFYILLERDKYFFPNCYTIKSSFFFILTFVVCHCIIHVYAIQLSI